MVFKTGGKNIYSGICSIHYSLHIPKAKKFTLFRYLDYTYSNIIKVSLASYRFCLIFYHVFLVFMTLANVNPSG